MPLISDKAVQAAFDYLNDAPDAAAKARADKILAEHNRKKVFSEIMLDSQMKSADLRRAFAESHPDYVTAYEQEARAVRADSWHMHQKARAMAIIDAWRTEQSNMRQTARVG